MYRMANFCGWFLSLLPIRAELLNEIGLVSFRMGRSAVAVAFLSGALRRDPRSGIAMYNLGLVSLHQGQLDRAASYFHEAIRLGALELESENNLGVVELGRHNFQHAQVHFLRVLCVDPTHADAKTNLGHALSHIRSLDEALLHYESVIRAYPDHVEAHFGAGICYLLTGRWRQGWKEYEWRFQRSERAKADLVSPFPESERWCGQPLMGKRILLRAEQGLGDTIQFCRFVAELTAMGATVFLAVQEPLVTLLRTLGNVEGVCAIGEEQLFAPIDFWSPLLSVPLWLDVSEATIPRRNPYLYADKFALERWNGRTGLDQETLRVGLVWVGNPAHENDLSRSLSLQQLACLARRNCIFYSLQCGPRESRTKNPPTGLALVSIASKLHDFSDTAAAIASMDLVITVDTAVAHLAGALGHPVWTLLPYNSDWRWLVHRNDSPWYPTMRLYRQRSLGDWESVLQAVASDLTHLSNIKRLTVAGARTKAGV